MLRAGQNQFFLSVRQIVLIQNIDNVTAEAANAFLQPEAEDLLYFLKDFWLMEVQIRLMRCEQMQIRCAAHIILLPAAAAKESCPVVRRSGPGVRPVVIILIWLDPLPALLKPFMLRRGMIDHQIHHDRDTPRLCLADQFIKIIHRSVIRMDA